MSQFLIILFRRFYFFACVASISYVSEIDAIVIFCIDLHWKCALNIFMYSFGGVLEDVESLCLFPFFHSCPLSSSKIFIQDINMYSLHNRN